MSMPGYFPETQSNRGRMISGSSSKSQYSAEEPGPHWSRWYFSRREIEENSPSRRDGINLKKEMHLRKSYCTFLQDLGMRLKVPQVAIATAIVFCHRFFLRQSHAKNDRRTIATVCMFLAAKVEESPRPLKDVIVVSYEIIHKMDPSALQKIKQKEEYEQRKELILLAEKVVLTTIDFDLSILHPYKPLVDSIKKLKVAQNTLAQVAWNFVNDGLRTSLCLQFEPHHIAAGAIFLAAKFLKVKLPSEGDRIWWQEFDVTPRQLEDISNQILELYEQNRAGQSSHRNDPECSTGDAKATSTVSENSVVVTVLPRYLGTAGDKQPAKVLLSSGALPALSNADSNQSKHQNYSSDAGSTDTKSGVWDNNMGNEGKDRLHCQAEPTSCIREQRTEALRSSKSSREQPVEGKMEALPSLSVGTKGQVSKFGDVTMLIDKDKVRAALKKRKQLRNDLVKKTDILDEDDLIERELENGFLMPAKDEKMKRERGRRHGWSDPLTKNQSEIGKRNVRVSDNQFSQDQADPKSFDHVIGNEELELSSLEEHDFSYSKLHNTNGDKLLDYPVREHKRHRFDDRGGTMGGA